MTCKGVHHTNAAAAAAPGAVSWRIESCSGPAVKSAASDRSAGRSLHSAAARGTLCRMVQWKAGARMGSSLAPWGPKLSSPRPLLACWSGIGRGCLVRGQLVSWLAGPVMLCLMYNRRGRRTGGKLSRRLGPKPGSPRPSLLASQDGSGSAPCCCCCSCCQERGPVASLCSASNASAARGRQAHRWEALSPPGSEARISQAVPACKPRWQRQRPLLLLLLPREGPARARCRQWCRLCLWSRRRLGSQLLQLAVLWQDLALL